MQQYKDFLEHIMKNGFDKSDRTGTGTRSVFGYQNRYDLSEGFPMVSIKKTPFKLISSELLWFIKGDTNIRYLLEHNNHIWTEWALLNYIKSDEYQGALDEDFGRKAAADPEYQKLVNEEMAAFEERILEDEQFAIRFGDLGPVYGKQWRNWEYFNDHENKWFSIDQLGEAIHAIKHSPDSRRIMVVAYNPAEVNNMALPPCHSLFQFYVANGKLSCQLYQRSADAFLGVPFNVSSYSLLTHLIAKECGLEVGEFIHTFGDAHIYSNHFEQVKEALSREPLPLPQLVLAEGKSIFDYEVEDIKLEGYESHPAIKAPIAV